MGNLLNLYTEGHVGYNINLSVEERWTDGAGAGGEGADHRQAKAVATATTAAAAGGGGGGGGGGGDNHVQLIKECEILLQDARRGLSAVREYSGCAPAIRQSMSNPHNIDMQVDAFECLLPNAKKLRSCFRVARSCEFLIVRLLQALVEQGGLLERQHHHHSNNNNDRQDHQQQQQQQHQHQHQQHDDASPPPPRPPPPPLSGPPDSPSADSQQPQQQQQQQQSVEPSPSSSLSFPPPPQPPSSSILAASPLSSTPTLPSLAVLLADILAFMLEWDQSKMRQPQVQNDFAYYRRLLPKMVDSKLLERIATIEHPELDYVTDYEANSISMFIAENAPFLVVVTAATTKAYRAEPRVASMVAMLANTCCGMVNRRVSNDPAVNRRLLMAMTSAVVLYDRISEDGVFAKGTGVGVSRCIRVLHRHGGSTGEQLKKCIKYSTMHFNEDTTPTKIRHALRDDEFTAS